MELHGLTTAAGSRGVDRVVTDADGHFDLGVQDAAMSMVFARFGEDEASARIDLADPAMRPVADHMVLDLRSCSRHVSGRLVDDARQPLAGVKVYAVVNVGELALRQVGRSDDDGSFSVCAQGGIAAGGGDLGLAMVPGRDHVGDVVLVPAMTVTGQVVESTGAPVGGALVWAIGNATSAAFIRGQPASTDREGRYELRLGPGCYDVLATQEGRSRYRAKLVCGGPGDRVDAPTIALDACAMSVEGVVRRSGRPAEELRVRLGRLNDITDRDGGFAFPCAFAGVLSVDGYLLDPPVELEDRSGAVRLDLNVIAGARVRGHVTSAGDAVGDAHVEAVEQGAVGNMTVLRAPQPWTRTRPDGSYELVVAPGRHHLEAWDRDSRRAESRWLDVSPDSGDIRVDLELDRGDTVHGVARQSSGQPAQGVRLSLRPRVGGATGDALAGRVKPGSSIGKLDMSVLAGLMERTRSATSDAAGRFGFGEVEAGTFVLDVGHGPWRLADGKEEIEIDVHSGQDNEVELVLSERAGTAIRGRVVGGDGRPIRYARVWIDLFEPVLVKPDGTFALDDLAAGTYRVRASSADDALMCRSTIAAGGPPVILTVSPPVSRKGREAPSDCAARSE